jgi:Putative zinc-finger
MTTNQANQAFKRQLTEMLYRADCPPAIELGDYQFGLLDKLRMAFVRQHVAECPHCSKELVVLDGYLTALAPQLPQSAEPPGLMARATERVRVWVGQLLPSTPNLALRGDDDGTEPQIYEAGAVQVSIDTQDDPDAPDRKLVLGLVMGAETVGWQAHLWRENQSVASVAIDEFGNFSAAGVQPGLHQLILSGDEAEVHLAVEVR